MAAVVHLLNAGISIKFKYDSRYTLNHLGVIAILFPSLGSIGMDIMNGSRRRWLMTGRPTCGIQRGGVDGTRTINKVASHTVIHRRGDGMRRGIHVGRLLRVESIRADKALRVSA